MSPSGENDLWTAPQLQARLEALKGAAPTPACHVLYRVTTRAGGRETSGYELPGDTEKNPPGRDEQSFERWLRDRGLAGIERLSVSVLVIRETLGQDGLVRDGVLERRRGGADGPLYGKVARVEFTSAAGCVRQYQAMRDGRLVELPIEPDVDMPPPFDDLDAENFAGEDAAVRAFLGSGAIILDRRAPTLFEDLLGLSGIIHARGRDGVEIGCGVGWHGGMAFVIPAAFPRLSVTLYPPPALARAMEEASRTHALVGCETRLDDQGFCVIARERDTRSLKTVRCSQEGVSITPYVPGRVTGMTDDQRRWMTYAETYEGRVILDSWRMPENGEAAVLTADADDEVWRHAIDADGVELSRRTDNESAVAILLRESKSLLPAGAEKPALSGAVSQMDETIEPSIPPDSLLSKVRAWQRVTALLRAAAGFCGAEARNERKVTRAALDTLRALDEPLMLLNAVFSLGSLRRLLRQGEAGTMSEHSFVLALEDLVTRLRDELALTRIVVLPSAARPGGDEPPFGAGVETRFPAAVYDIEEAVHCLALRRATAAVLHAMKVMSHGLRGVERLFGTGRLTDLSWARQVLALRTAAPDENDLLEALIRVRRAWRAPTLMPADKYTEQEAEAVLEAVASFMRALTACHDARGEPPGD